MKTTDPYLRRVERATAARQRAEDEYRASIRAAVAEGRKSHAEVGRAAGVTRQRIRRGLIDWV